MGKNSLAPAREPFCVSESFGMIWRLTLLTNPDVCNLDCALCFLRQRKRPFGMGEMPWEIAENAVRTYAAHGLREVIPSTMGEPLLWTHFEKLGRLVAELGLKLNVTTNGSFPGKGPERWTENLLPISRDIKVSCWGILPETWKKFCPSMNLQDYFRNLKTLAHVRKSLRDQGKSVAELSLQMAVSKSNIQEVKPVVGMAAELGFDRVKLNRAVFLGGEEPELLKESLPAEDSVELSFAKDLPVRLEGTLVKSQSQKLAACPFFGREIWILPDGSEEPCPDPGRRYSRSAAKTNRCTDCLLFPDLRPSKGSERTRTSE